MATGSAVRFEVRYCSHCGCCDRSMKRSSHWFAAHRQDFEMRGKDNIQLALGLWCRQDIRIVDSGEGTAGMGRIVADARECGSEAETRAKLETVVAKHHH